MEKYEFQSYCKRINDMMTLVPDWQERPSSIVGDYLRESTSYGYGQALSDLLADACCLLKEYGGETDLYELAGVMTVRCGNSSYRFGAYFFVLSVAAVCIGRKRIDDVDAQEFDANEFVAFEARENEDGLSPEQRRLKKFGARLLDFSRANQLVHFHPSGRSALMLYCKDVNGAASALKKGGRLRLGSWDEIGAKTIVKCRNCGNYKVVPYVFSAKKQHAVFCERCDGAKGRVSKSMLPVKEQLVVAPDDAVKCPRCSASIPIEQLSRGDFLCKNCGETYNAESFPIVGQSALDALSRNEAVCGVGDANVALTAKSLINRSAAMERNFGLQVLYLACGFLHWKDRNNVEYRSPLLLCPAAVNVDRSTGEASVVMRGADAGFEVNRTLLYMLSAYSEELAISLPQFEGGSVKTYFTLIKEYFKNANKRLAYVAADWYVEQNMGLGLFHYQKLQLYDDLTAHAQQYLRHPVVRRLCGDGLCALPAAPSGGEIDYMLMDADSRQEEVIAAAQSGRSFVLQGPPGSGKSQTITNIIACALGAGRKVLFVTEKAAARAVILDNLKHAFSDGTHSLTDFVLDLETFAKRGGAVGREPFVRELNKCLQTSDINVSDDQSVNDEMYAKSQIERYSEQLKRSKEGKNCLQLLRDAAPYCEYDMLAAPNAPCDPQRLAHLCGLLERYYVAVKARQVSPDYKQDPLYGCKGDTGNQLLLSSQRYLSAVSRLENAVKQLQGLGVRVELAPSSLEQTAHFLTSWQSVPALPKEILSRSSAEGVDELIARAKRRKKEAYALQIHSGNAVEAEIDRERYERVNVESLVNESARYKMFWRRWGKRYRRFADKITGCFRQSGKRGFKRVFLRLRQLNDFFHLEKRRASYAKQSLTDAEMFGFAPQTEKQWSELTDKLLVYRTALSESRIFNESFLLSFETNSRDNTVRALARLKEELTSALQTEKKEAEVVSGYFDFASADGKYPCFRSAATLAVEQKGRLGAWSNVTALLSEFEANGWTAILDELLSKGVKDYQTARNVLLRSKYVRDAKQFAERNKLTSVTNFDRAAHKALINRYALADKAVLSVGGERLYARLAELLRNACGASGGSLRKIVSKTGYSIKRTVAENRDLVLRIKPCFMMSPLNVAQYLDTDVNFDLVIFDEASQIFTEDALASIVRARQVIVVGDSKQLPPCDFFRTKDVSVEEDAEYYEAEYQQDCSLLTAADEALNETSMQLCWHYRSYDEALIAFSNKEMDYDLITFPSAVKNPDDGVEYVGVPYDPSACYDAGKNGSHVNSGEADRIVQLLWREITHPIRKKFTLGVVAFSNAQALEIEERWEQFKCAPDKKPVVDEWESSHADEPIVFCNLDTMQGDERDTVILSVCYSPDSNGKFMLSYLGRLRLASGRKRLNVAVTRARHRMTVVSTLTRDVLDRALSVSAASDENKSGAVMLRDFLGYAESFYGGGTAAEAPSRDPLVQSVCKLFDEHGIKYATEIGRSDCKINVGIRHPLRKGDFVLGIIVDDPRRTDLDSPREYARLTEDVLKNKYNWNIYRLYPVSWIFDYDNEKQLLLQTVKEALLAA